MQLWTDYEGVTIDGAFPLKKLLMPEGRSAFYLTSGPNGEPTVVRLIECHFDEEEILSRWRCVDALNHPHFLKFEKFGQTEIDGRPVVYAVLEKVDANLAEVLDRGSLGVKDVAQLGTSLVAALDVLHTHGFIHEHVEPRNIFAIGEVVKLRSDCIREAPEGEEGRAAKQRDVHDLATVLLQGLTQRTSLDGVPASALPAPFAQIIRHGLDGTWELESIKTALESHFASKPAAVAEQIVPAPTQVDVPLQYPAPAAAPVSIPRQQLPLPLATEQPSARFTRSLPGRDPWDDDPTPPERSSRVGLLSALGVILLLFIWGIVHVLSSHARNNVQSTAVTAPIAQPAQSTPAPLPAPPVAPRAAAIAPPEFRPGWRVIAFTYNRRADAEHKVADLRRHFSRLDPAVFSPAGHAPYFVSIGGVMDERAAEALARRARSLGLPRDSFARSYGRTQ